MSNNMRTILVILTAIIMISWAWAEQGPETEGRFLPGGLWQARNTRATQPEPIDNDDNPFDIFTEWGTDIRLSYTEGPRIHDPEIAAWGNYVYVTWWNVEDDQVDLARSIDLGATWQPQVRISDPDSSYTGIPQIAVEDSCVYVVYTTGASWIWMAKSSDCGQSWSRRNIYRTGRNWGGGPTIAVRDSQLYCVFGIQVDYVPPTDEDMFIYGSNDYGETWPDTFFVSDTTFAGIGPELVVNCLSRQPDPVLHLIRETGISPSTQEVLYQRSTDGGQSWLGPVIISDNDTIHSFWPQIGAWGDSFVIATWVDYKSSDQQFTGDAFMAKSTDNGETWSTPIAMTSSHLIKSSDVAVSGDTIILVYDQGPFGGNAVILANISFDGGETWEGETRVSESPERCIEPTVALSYGMGHVSWSDARDDSTHSNGYEAYYDRGDLLTGIWGEGQHEPHNEITISAYPNPFNASVTITITNAKGGEIEIGLYDISGRLVRKIEVRDIPEGGGIKKVWDATDTSGKKVSSGIYFARIAASQRIFLSRLALVK